MPVVLPLTVLARRAFQTAPPDGTSFFTSGASPPIIIGFICLGAFTFGILIVACWRRTHMRGQDRRRSASKSKALLQKPRLHEVVLDVNGAAEGARYEGKMSQMWAQIMPLSSVIEQPEQPEPDYEPTPKTPAMQAYASYQRWRRSRRGAIENIERPQSTFQATVLLAMPSPRSSSGRESGQGDQEEMPEYALGTHMVRVAWRMPVSPPTPQDSLPKGPRLSRTQRIVQSIARAVYP